MKLSADNPKLRMERTLFHERQNQSTPTPMGPFQNGDILRVIGNEPGRKIFMNVCVIVDRQSKLFQIIHTLTSACCFPRRLNGR
jgi:hypothetical protein